uniref:Reverse transcriptase domain-containing protein n=1 Tax=Trichuris muris TaxID=70415 RepID=A0A5S6QNH2_TRIMR
MAYEQLEVDAASAEAQALVTHKGLFRVKRLQFGVSTAPGIFENLMDTRLAGIAGVFPYFDNILIVAESEEELANKLREVLRRFEEDGLRVRRDKCIFNAKKVEFFGYSIDEEEIQPTEEKVRCIHETPRPKSRL